MTRQGLAVFFSSAAIAQMQRLLRSSNGHIKEPPFFVKCAFLRRAGVRQQPILQPDHKNTWKFQTLATVHCDENYGVAFEFILGFAIAVETQVFQELFQPVSRSSRRIFIE